MKKVIVNLDAIVLDNIDEHGCIGVIDKTTKYVAAQVEPGIYMLLNKDNSNGVNRRDSIKHNGCQALVKYYLSKGEDVYSFDSSHELLNWFLKY